MGLLVALQKLFSRIGRWWFKLRLVGVENIPLTGPVIVASNHVHLCDPIMHAFCIPRGFYTMAKKELFSFKPFGWLLSKLGAFPVERGHHDRTAIQRASRVLEGGDLLLIFPEGTRSKTGELGTFKTGTSMFALLNDAPVVPAVIWAPNGVRFRSGVTIEYGEPIRFSEIGETTQVDRKMLKQATEVLRCRVEEMQTAWKSR